MTRASRRMPAFLAACLALAATLAVHVSPAYADEPKDSPDAIMVALADRDWAGALAKCAAHSKDHPASAHAPLVRLLTARALLESGQAEKAIALAGELAKDVSSPVRGRAAALEAEALVRAGQHPRAAELLLARLPDAAGEAAYTLLAQRIRALADASEQLAADPTNATGPQSLERAARLLVESARLEPTLTQRIQDAARVAEIQGRLGQNDGAIQTWDQILAVDLKVTKPADKLTPELRARALLGRAQARLNLASQTPAQILVQLQQAPQNQDRRGGQIPAAQADLARADLRALLDDYPASTLRPRALYVLAASYAPSSAGPNGERGIGYARELVKQHPDAPEARLASILIATAHAARGEHADAITASDEHVARYGQDPSAGTAAFLAASSALAIGRHDDAVARFARYLADYATGDKWQAAREQIEQAKFARGQAAFERKNWKAAEAGFEAYLADHADGKSAAQAHYALGALALAQGDTARAEARWKTLVARFAATAEARRARLEVCGIAERAGDLERAARELAALGAAGEDSPERQEAHERLAQLREVELTVTAPRVFRAGEPARLMIATRNLSALDVLVYAFDLPHHLRKHRTLGAIHEVATEIVAPTHKLAHTVAGYQRYRPHTYELALPCDGAGAWLVEVRTGTRRAKVLVLKSDLELVARLGATEAVAFVQLARAAAPGVEVVALSSGGVTSAKTGADGVATLARERVVTTTDDSDRTLLLAERNGHVAFAEMAIPRHNSTGSGPQGYVYTDRPLYRPGDQVHYRALIRSPEVGGGFKVPAKTRATVAIRDARGLGVHLADHDVNAYGAIDGAVELGDEPALGEYAIQVTLDLGTGTATFAGKFWVEAYRVPPFEVAVKAADEVRYAGETADVSLTARYRFGSTVANAEVAFYVVKESFEFDRGRYADFAAFLENPDQGEVPQQGQIIHTEKTRTNAAGEAKLGWRLPESATEQRYLIVARVSDAAGQLAEGAASVIGVERGYHAILKADRQAYRPGEGIAIDLLTVRADHAPIAVDGTLAVSRAPAKGETWAEVETRKISTATSGKAEARFEIKEPGRYRIQYVGQDRAGRRVADQVVIEVAGDDPAKAIKLVAEHRVYRQGDVARVHLNTPAEGLSVLLTLEAEGVLSHQIVHVPGRSVELALPMTAELAPNAFIVASALADNVLYCASEPVRVVEYLDVSVTPKSPTARPGEKVALAIETKDQRGQPIAAQISCAVVDSGVLQLRSDPAGSIKARFYNRTRSSALVGASSAFDFTGRDLAALDQLNEEERFQESQKELAALKKSATEAYAKEKQLAQEPNADPRKSEDALGEGGGAGGTFGGRHGGRMNLRTRGGGAASGGEDAAIEFLDAAEYLGRSSSRLLEVDELAKSIALLKHRKVFKDTAHWDASVATGADGKATVAFELPHNLTTWTITVRGASTKNHLGDAKGSFRTTQPVLAEMRAPAHLIEGDQATAVLEVHNSTDQGVRAQAAFRQQAAGDEPSELAPDRELDIAARSVVRSPVALVARKAGGQILEGAVVAGSEGDRVQVALPILPAGTKVLRAGAGRLASSAERVVQLPPYADPASAKLTIGIDPDPDSSLERALDELRDYPYGCFEQTISRFLPAVAAIVAYQEMGRPNDRLKQRFLPIAHAGMQRLYGMQHASGGWGWWGNGEPQPAMTGYGLLALELCAASGLVPVLNDRLALARAGAVAALTAANDAEKALICWGLSFSGTLANGGAHAPALEALDRRRERLSPAALALAALAAHRSGHGAMAQAMTALLRTQSVRDGEGLCWKGDDGFLSGALEGTALATLALATVGGQSDRDRVRAACDHLLAHRRGAGWGSTKTSALVVLALAKARSLLESPLAAYTVDVKVNGKKVGSFEVAAGQASRRLDLTVPADVLAASNTIVFDKQGEGVLHFWYRLEAFRRGKVAPDGAGMRINRQLRRASDPLNASHAPVGGQTIIRDADRAQKAIASPERIGIGELVRVELTLELDDDADYVMIEDPIPAGCFVEARDKEGAFDRQETRLDRQVFFFTRLAKGTHAFSYHVRALFPGRFTLNPARAELMYQPATYAHGANGTLEVVRELPAEEKLDGSPDALLAQADELFAKGAEHAAAADELYVRLHAMPLKPEVDERVAQRLVALRLEAGGARLVQAYEMLHDAGKLHPRTRYRVAQAYAGTGNAVTALELARVIYDEQLGAIQRMSAAYREMGRAAEGQILEGERLALLAGTPAHVERTFEWAAAWEQTPPDETRQHGDVGEAIHQLRLLMATWPTSEVARLASRRVIELAGRIEAHARVIDEAERFLVRYPDEPRKDEVLLALAQASFAADLYDKADKAGAALETATTGDDARTPSPHRPYAIYLRAKIAHARGKLAQAIDGYRKVATTYEDAAATVRFFERKVLELPAVVRTKTGQTASVPLTYRNAASIEVALYPVDLLTLFLMRKGEGATGKIDLAGIAPTLKLDRKLPAAPGFETRTESLSLGELAPGAYWVVGRSGESEVTSFVLVSTLELRVQLRDGRIQVHAFEGGKPAANVQVRVAARGGIVARGATDARGLFSSALDGEDATVIAYLEAEGKNVYALWSSK